MQGVKEESVALQMGQVCDQLAPNSDDCTTKNFSVKMQILSYQSV